jgi:hypothetical protein
MSLSAAFAVEPPEMLAARLHATRALGAAGAVGDDDYAALGGVVAGATFEDAARVARVVPLLVRAALGVDADDVAVLGTMQAAAPLAMPLTLVVGALRRSRRREREPAPRPSTRVAYAARRQARAVPMARRQRRRHVRRGAPVGRRRDHYRTFACCGFAGFADFSACGDTTRLLRLGL